MISAIIDAYEYSICLHLSVHESFGSRGCSLGVQNGVRRSSFDCGRRVSAWEVVGHLQIKAYAPFISSNSDAPDKILCNGAMVFYQNAPLCLYASLTTENRRGAPPPGSENPSKGGEKRKKYFCAKSNRVSSHGVCNKNQLKQSSGMWFRDPLSAVIFGARADKAGGGHHMPLK